jgi:serine/threonine-protein kinase
MSQARALPEELAGRFQVLRALGRGAQGAVFLAYQKDLDRNVVLKWNPAFGTGELAARWEQEARVIQQLRHPGVVALLDCGRVGDGGYLVYPDDGGRDLWVPEVAAAWRAPERILLLLEQVLDALVEVHAAGLVHRDLKPGNLIALPDDRVQLIDFGVVQDPSHSGVRTATGVFLGTPAYLPAWSDQVSVDPRNDLYALGVTAYEVWTGGNPFRGGSMAECIERTQTLVPPPPSHDGRAPAPGLAGFVMRLLEKDLQRMPPDAATARRWLAQVSEAAPASPEEPSARRKTAALDPPRRTTPLAPARIATGPRSTPMAPSGVRSPTRLELRGARATGLLAVGAVALAVMAALGARSGPQARPAESVPASAPVDPDLLTLRLAAVRQELEAVFADPRRMEALEVCRDPAERGALYQALPSLGPLRRAVATLDPVAPPPDQVDALNELGSDLEASGWGYPLAHRPSREAPPPVPLEAVVEDATGPVLPGEPPLVDARGALALAWRGRARQELGRLIDELTRGEYGALEEFARTRANIQAIGTGALPKASQILDGAVFAPRRRQLLEERTRALGRSLTRFLLVLTRSLEEAPDPVWLVAVCDLQWRSGWTLTPPELFYRPVEETLGPLPPGMAGDLLTLELAMRMGKGGWPGEVQRPWGRSATEAALAILGSSRRDLSAQRARVRALTALVRLAEPHGERAISAALERAIEGFRELHPALEVHALVTLKERLGFWGVDLPWYEVLGHARVLTALREAAGRAWADPVGRAWIQRSVPELAPG